MSFKRFDPEDIVLSSELITFPTWFVEGKGDFDEIEGSDLVESPLQGASREYFIDYYNGVSSDSSSGEGTGSNVVFDPTQSKCMFSVTFAKQPEDGYVAGGDYKPEASEIVFGQYRSLVLGDEDSGFRFGSTQIDAGDENVWTATKFFAVTVDRSRFREKLEPVTCRLTFSNDLVLAPDITANEKHLDSGRVYDLAKYEVTDGTASYIYPTISSSKTSYGYFLPDIGVMLFNADIEPFSSFVGSNTAVSSSAEKFKNEIVNFKLRSQETVTSNYVFARARNAEFNYSTNPSNITGSAGNLRWGTMINQPQAFITTVGLYNDSNELLAVAKLSKPLVKDFTKEALIRIKVDY